MLVANNAVLVEFRKISCNKLVLLWIGEWTRDK